MTFFLRSDAVLHPENYHELYEWARKWNITIEELGRAIVETGTTNIRALREHIRRNRNSRPVVNMYSGNQGIAISR